MLQALIVKKVLEVVFKKIETKHKLNKLKKYVEEENELDIKVKDFAKRIAKLERLAHPKADFVCTGCGCKAKRKVNKRRKK